MKSAEEWTAEAIIDWDGGAAHKFVEAIQRDALESAALACEAVDQHAGEDYSMYPDSATYADAIRAMLPPEPQEKP